jgi:predicted DNA-binding WGR domain protein
MNHVYLERHDTENNMHRFYQMFVTPGLFDDWSLIKEWGRVGSPGTVRKEWFNTQEEAIVAGNNLCAAKCKKGYHAISAEK